MLSVLIHRAVNAFVFQNQIRSRRMSGPDPQTPRRTAGTTCPSSRSGCSSDAWRCGCRRHGRSPAAVEPGRRILVLAILSILAMVGTFFLFGARRRATSRSASAADELSRCCAPPSSRPARASRSPRATAVSSTPTGRSRPSSALVAMASRVHFEEAFAGEPLAAECLFRLMLAADRGETLEEEFRVRDPEARTRAARWIRLGVKPLKPPGGARATHTRCGTSPTSPTSARARPKRCASSRRRSPTTTPCRSASLRAAAGAGVTHLNATLAGWLGARPRHDDGLAL